MKKSKIAYLMLAVLFLVLFSSVHANTQNCATLSPVCAEKQDKCDSKGDFCSFITKTYKNKCVAKKSGAQILHNGPCTKEDQNTPTFPESLKYFDLKPIAMDYPYEISPLPKKITKAISQNSNLHDDLQAERTAFKDFKELTDGLWVNKYDLNNLQTTKQASLRFIVFPDWGAFEGRAGFMYISDKDDNKLSKKFPIIYKDFDWLDKFVKGEAAAFYAELDINNIADGEYFLNIENVNPSGMEKNKKKIKMKIRIEKYNNKTTESKTIANNEEKFKQILQRKFNVINFINSKQESDKLFIKAKLQCKLFFLIPFKINAEFMIKEDSADIHIINPGAFWFSLLNCNN